LGVPTITWQQSNGFEVDVDSITAAFLLAQGSEFESGDPVDTFASLVVGSGSGRILAGGRFPLSAVISTASVGPVNFVGGGISKTAIIGTRPITVKYGGFLYHTVANGNPQLRLYIDGLQYDYVLWESLFANKLGYVEREILIDPNLSPGLHTFELKLGQVTAVAGANALGTSLTPQTLFVREG
jgi:hypothetical protein